MAETQTTRGIGEPAEGDDYIAPEDGQSSQDSGQTRRYGRFRVTRKPAEDAQAGTQAGVDESTIGVEQPLPRTRRCSICGQTGHRASTCPNSGSTEVATRARKTPASAQIGLLGASLVGTANFCVATTFGPECGLTDLEGKMLVPSVQRMFERMPAEAAQKASIFIDPAIILTVMVMWGRRIYQVQKAKQIAQYAVDPREAARAAGYSGYEYNTDGTSPAQQAQSAHTNATAAYNGPTASVSDIDAAIRDRARNENGTASATYGAPEHLRRGFDDAI